MRPILILLLVALSACAGMPRSGEPAPFTLRILHINDHHSRLGPDPGQTLIIDGVDTEVVYGGFAQVVAKMKAREAAGGHVLKLHAGDALAGDLYFTLFHGQADADLMNQVCFDAFALGNHEFDAGDTGLRRFLDHLRSPAWDCDMPVLGANVRPGVGQSPLAMVDEEDYIRPYVVLERGGRRIGVIGIDIVGKTVGASSPYPGTRFLDEEETARRYIAKLRDDGVSIIVLLTHIGYRNDLALAEALAGVDVIVGGDSHSLLGEGFRAFGLRPEGPYPTVTRNADGDPVCVVHAWQYSWLVGELEVEFDADDRVTRCGGQPHLLLGDEFRRDGAPLVGATRDALLQAIAAAPELSVVSADPHAQKVLDYYEGQVEAYAGEVIGRVPERLCLRRIPGSMDRSRDGSPGCAEATDAQGGDIQQLVAMAFLRQAQRYGGADIAIQNGGGVRYGLPPGDFSVGSAYSSLPFKNTLTRLHMTGAEIRAVLEDAVDHFLANVGAHTGSYPYAAGLRWHADLSRDRAAGRLVDVEVWSDGGWMALPEDGLFAVITNNYIAEGKDGYLAFADIPRERREDTGLDYAQALVDYVRGGGSLARPSPSERSTRTFRDRDGVLYAP
ncbi:MAG TPA: 5'-nucleotidase C-terminal domain-containing protein [Xanthomonadaceae bacterium]|nr:5'-nucleotidase C-terminal domain-containing protein [Xanthomonadaceae bacterium]